jgi:hypothetical protein
MSYIVNKTALNIGGNLLQPGDVVADDVVDAINPTNKATLIREGVLVPEGQEAPEPKDEAPKPVGDGRRAKEPQGSNVSIKSEPSKVATADLETIKDQRGGELAPVETPDIPDLDAVEEVEDEEEEEYADVEDDGDDLLDDDDDEDEE